MNKYNSRISTSGEHPLREPTNVQIPDRTLVPVEGTQSLSVLGSPNRGSVILRGSEEQIAVVIELHDGYRTLVSFK